MKTKIQKWGNSLGVRLPKSVAEQKALRAGTGVSVVLKDEYIAIVPLQDEVSLASLLSQISGKNLHDETEWSGPLGNEVW